MWLTEDVVDLMNSIADEIEEIDKQTTTPRLIFIRALLVERHQDLYHGVIGC